MAFHPVCHVVYFSSFFFFYIVHNGDVQKKNVSYLHLYVIVRHSGLKFTYWNHAHPFVAN